MERGTHRTRASVACRGRAAGDGGERRCVADGGESAGGARGWTLQHIVGEGAEPGRPGGALADRAHGKGSGVLSIAAKVNRLRRIQSTMLPIGSPISLKQTSSLSLF